GSDAEHLSAPQGLYHPLFVGALGLRPRAGNGRGVLRTTPAVGARGNSDSLPGGRTVRPRPDMAATLAVLADILAFGRPEGAVYRHHAGCVPVAGGVARIRRHGSRHRVLCRSDRACSCRRYERFYVGPALGAGISGPEYVP